MNTTETWDGHGRRPRATKYGLPITKGASLTNNDPKTYKTQPTVATVKKPKALAPASNKSYPKYSGSTAPRFHPISNETTNYGAKKFRTPYKKDQFTGRAGSPQKVVILDIDGTLQGWGQSGDKDTMKWVKKHYDAGHLLVVVTARDDNMYDTSFNWLMRNIPFPFIGPFCRASDDPRYASEFKRELCQGFEDSGMWEIVGAADDNKFVIDMWEKWAKEHYENPADFDLLKCDTYASYDGWRTGLPSKGKGLYDDWYGTGGYTTPKTYSTPNHKGYSGSASHKGEHWVNGYNDPVTKVWVKGHYVKDEPDTTPGSSAFKSPWVKNDVEIIPGGDPQDITMDPRWQFYLQERGKAGAYSNEPEPEDPNVIEGEVVSDDLDLVMAEIEADRFGNGLRRQDLISIVSYEYPGYEEQELLDMADDELCELAGLTPNKVISDERWDEHVYGGEDDPLFEDWQLVPEGEDIVPDERNTLIIERLEMEEEVYAADWDMRKSDFANMSFDALFDKWVKLNEAKERADSEPDEAQTVSLDVREVLG